MTATMTSSSKNHHSSSGRPTNPISRNSEISNPMRRSFSGSPFNKPSIISGQRIGFNPSTPVNSPSDCPRRHSFSRENMVATMREQEDKENGRDLNGKQARVRSPASSKGTKNFMSPTISAASKVNASPRKRIFGERNEQARTSISFSDGKSPLVPKPQKEVSFDEAVTYLGDQDHEHIDSNVSSGTEDDCGNFDSRPGSVTDDKDSVNLDPSFEISPKGPCYWTSPALAPLDADPSMPPYDPKTNYLSPRPQFLHYRPNPRIEPYLNMENDGQKLEERFDSEMSSDSDFTDEENQSDDSLKESEDISCDLPKEEAKEDLKEMGEEQEGGLLSSEPYPISVSEGAAEPDPITSSQSVAEAKPLSRPRFSRAAKVNALLFVLAATCLGLLLVNSPVMEPSVLNNLSFPELYLPPKISEFSRHHFEVAYQKVQLWLHQCSSYTWNLIIRFSERHKLGSLQYVNSSTLIENPLVGHLDHSFLVAEPKYEKNGLRPLRDIEAYNNLLVVGEGQTTEGDENIEDDNMETCDENFEYCEEEGVPESEELKELGEQWLQTALAAEDIEASDENFEYSKEERVPESEELKDLGEQWVQTAPAAENIEAGDGESGENFEYPKEEGVPESEVVDHGDQRVQTAPAVEIQPEVLDSTELERTRESSSLEAESVLLPILQSDTATENPPSSELVGSTVGTLQGVFAAHKMQGISLLVLCVLASVALIRMKNQKPKIANAVPTMNQVSITTKKVDNSPMSVTGEHTVHERRLSSSNRQTEVDMLGEPSCCPSEMSSFQNSFSSSRVLQRSSDEAHSKERNSRKNYRRESLASSDYSTGSLSYGSFTTYEKITSKQHGNGDEEVITPVRRSSRLRNHVTSP